MRTDRPRTKAATTRAGSKAPRGADNCRAHAQTEVKCGKHRHEERERVAVGKCRIQGCELALAGGIGLVEVEDVHEIVVHHSLGHAVLLAGERDSTGSKVVCYGASERTFGAVGEGVKASGESRVAVHAEYKAQGACEATHALLPPHSLK